MILLHFLLKAAAALTLWVLAASCVGCLVGRIISKLMGSHTDPMVDLILSTPESLSVPTERTLPVFYPTEESWERFTRVTYRINR